MKQEYAAQRLTIYLSERDQWRGGPLYAALVARLHEAGIAGVTVLHGIERRLRRTWQSPHRAH